MSIDAYSQKTLSTSSLGKKKEVVFLMALLAVSLSLNVFLGWRVQRLKSASNRPVLPLLSLGTLVPPMIVGDLNDQQEMITFANADKQTVLYVFSTKCSWCDRNVESIKTLANLAGNSHRFIGLALIDSDLKKYVDDNKLNFPVYKQLSPDAIHLLALGRTPQTIVLSSEGKVLKNWAGAYTENLQREVEAYFGARIPGLISNGVSEGGCAHCVKNGLLYSPGAIATIDDIQMRCREDGQWVKF